MRFKILFTIQLFLFSFNSVIIAGGNDSYKLLHITDIHFCDLSGYDSTLVKKRKHYGNIQNKFSDFLQTNPSHTGTDAVSITGDLIDFYYAETATGTMKSTQIEQFSLLLGNCTVPVLSTLGNHDITTYWINDFLQKESCQYQANIARSIWTRNIPCFFSGTYYTKKVNVGGTEYYIIFLDNGYELGNNTFLDIPQQDWLNFQLKQIGDKPVVIFMHKFIPIMDYNGDGMVFSNKKKIDINTCCSTGLLKTLNENPNIKLIVTGHGHKDKFEYIPFPTGHEILQIETAAFAVDENNWRVIELTTHKLNIYKTGSTLIEHIIQVKQDPNEKK